MREKKPCNKAETVIKSGLKIGANRLHGGKQGMDKVELIALSNDTMAVRGTMIAQDLKLQLIAKLMDTPCFALQFDETTDIKNDAQLIFYCRCPATSVGKIVKHFLFCPPIWQMTTGESIFCKLNELFHKDTGNLSWKKCIAVSTDGAAAMMGKQQGR